MKLKYKIIKTIYVSTWDSQWSSEEVAASLLSMNWTGSKPSALVVLVGALFLQGSMVYAIFVGMHILDMDLCDTVRIRDMKPSSISTACTQPKKKLIQQILSIRTYILQSCPSDEAFGKIGRN